MKTILLLFIILNYVLTREISLIKKEKESLNDRNFALYVIGERKQLLEMYQNDTKWIEYGLQNQIAAKCGLMTDFQMAVSGSVLTSEPTNLHIRGTNEIIDLDTDIVLSIQEICSKKSLLICQEHLKLIISAESYGIHNAVNTFSLNKSDNLCDIKFIYSQNYQRFLEKPYVPRSVAENMILIVAEFDNEIKVLNYTNGIKTIAQIAKKYCEVIDDWRGRDVRDKSQRSILFLYYPPSQNRKIYGFTEGQHGLTQMVRTLQHQKLIYDLLNEETMELKANELKIFGKCIFDTALFDAEIGFSINGKTFNANLITTLETDRMIVYTNKFTNPSVISSLFNYVTRQ